MKTQFDGANFLLYQHIMQHIPCSEVLFVFHQDGYGKIFCISLIKGFVRPLSFAPSQRLPWNSLSLCGKTMQEVIYI